MTITYRPATPADFEFLYALHREAMRAAVEETLGAWDEAWQRDDFHRRFDPQSSQVIQFAGQDVGVMWVQPRAEELFLVALEILPAYQGQGIGSQALRGLLDDARRQGKPVALQVLKGNRRARDLYQRLGFGVTGENDTHYIMAWEK